MEDDLIAHILLGHLIALPTLWAVVSLILNEKKVRATLGRPAGVPLMPAAEETRRSVIRFQEAARRHELSDFVWERWLRSRALFFH